jgi:hypothetical protein
MNLHKKNGMDAVPMPSGINHIRGRIACPTGV